jgi:molybdenum cofactor guanylyltransferase
MATRLRSFLRWPVASASFDSIEQGIDATVRSSSCLAGIFVGGKSSRMQGVPKGLLRPPSAARNLVERLRDELKLAGVRDVVLVGENDAYASVGVRSVPDVALGQGPMAGLLALVQCGATEHDEFVLAVACDMPALDRATMRRLVHEQREAAALVPRRSHFEPLCARYRIAEVRPHLVRLLESGQQRMMHLLKALGAGCVPIDFPPSQYPILADWDCLDDLPEGVTYRGLPLRLCAKPR